MKWIECTYLNKTWSTKIYTQKTIFKNILNIHKIDTCFVGCQVFYVFFLISFKKKISTYKFSDKALWFKKSTKHLRFNNIGPSLELQWLWMFWDARRYPWSHGFPIPVSACRHPQRSLFPDSNFCISWSHNSVKSLNSLVCIDYIENRVMYMYKKS